MTQHSIGNEHLESIQPGAHAQHGMRVATPQGSYTISLPTEFGRDYRCSFDQDGAQLIRFGIHGKVEFQHNLTPAAVEAFIDGWLHWKGTQHPNAIQAMQPRPALQNVQPTTSQLRGEG